MASVYLIKKKLCGKNSGKVVAAVYTHENPQSQTSEKPQLNSWFVDGRNVTSFCVLNTLLVSVEDEDTRADFMRKN